MTHNSRIAIRWLTEQSTCIAARPGGMLPKSSRSMRPLAKEPIERVCEESTKYERWSANITWHYSRSVTQLKVINSAVAVVPKP